MKLLEGKVAIITGGGSGIGEHTALLFAENGAKVVITDVNEEHGNTVVEKIKQAGGEALFVKADTSKAEDSKKTVDATIEEFGKLDIAVNNAGIGGDQSKIADYSEDTWNKVIGINLSGVFYGMKYQIAAMQKSGSGSIINVSSILGSVGTPMSAPYVAAKHGVVGLTKTAALEYAADGIRVNSVGPGYIETPLLNSLPEEQKEELVKLHPMGRLGRSEEIAELFLWLASDKASFVTGSYYTIDGGYTAQ